MAEVAPAPEATTPEVATEPEVPEEEEIVPINVPILKLIKQQQMEHGLRHRDYNQYRRYCTNRARRLRRFLNFKLGEKRKVTPRKITPWEIKQNVQFIILMIVNIEVKMLKISGVFEKPVNLPVISARLVICNGAQSVGR